MNGRVALVLALVIAASACGPDGCRKKTVDASASDAEAAAPDAAIAEIPFAVVAEGPPGIRIDMTSDGRIVVVDGPTLYEAKPDGSLDPILPPSELAKLLPDDDIVVGYPKNHEVANVFGALGGMLAMKAYGPASFGEVFTYSSGKLSALPDRYMLEAVHRDHPLGWDPIEGTLVWVDGASLPVPRAPDDVQIDWGSVTEGPRGQLLAFAGVADNRQLVVWTPESEVARVIPFPKDESRCTLVPSFAQRIVMVCTMKAHMLEGDRFVTSYGGTEPYPTPKASQDVTGALHFVSDERVFRCPAEGKCTMREMPKRNTTKAAWYTQLGTEFAREDLGTTYHTLVVEADPGDAKRFEILQLLARGPNDVWLVLGGGTRAQIAHTSAPPAKPKLLPSTTDARIALRSTRPAARWTASCDQVYVRLGSDADAIVKRAGEIVTALERPKPAGDQVDVARWALVEGTIDGERGVGVVLARRTPIDKIALIDSAVRKLVKAFATGPANEPSVYCSLPILERVLLSE
jgi:hypothetical protein